MARKGNDQRHHAVHPPTTVSPNIAVNKRPEMYTPPEAAAVKAPVMNAVRDDDSEYPQSPWNIPADEDEVDELATKSLNTPPTFIS
jgi:hypothetical protein